MRLLTKEWYRTMNDSGLGVMLQADRRAGEGTEAAYKAIRAEKLESWLREQAEVCEVLKQPFDPEASRQQFDEYTASELEHFRNRTPRAILDKVADIRLLALGACTEAVYRDFEAFREACEEKTQRTLEEAWEQFQAQNIPWTGGHGLHDSYVLALKREGEDLLAEFERDEEADWPEIEAIRFRDAKILTQEQPVEEAFWLYDEVWRTGDGIEVHALLWRENDIFELTVHCRDTELVWTVEPKSE